MPICSIWITGLSRRTLQLSCQKMTTFSLQRIMSKSSSERKRSLLRLLRGQRQPSLLLNLIKSTSSTNDVSRAKTIVKKQTVDQAVLPQNAQMTPLTLSMTKLVRLVTKKVLFRARSSQTLSCSTSNRYRTCALTSEILRRQRRPTKRTRSRTSRNTALSRLSIPCQKTRKTGIHTLISRRDLKLTLAMPLQEMQTRSTKTCMGQLATQLDSTVSPSWTWVACWHSSRQTSHVPPKT